MGKLQLNELHRLTLWRFLQTQGKGRGHLSRIDRILRACRIDAIEAKIDDAQEQIDDLRAAGKPVPRVLLNAGMRTTDPPDEIEIADADLEKTYHRVLAAWGKEIEADPGKDIDPVCQACGRAREVQDPRIQLRILEEVERAWAEVEAARASKSDGAKAPGGDAPPTHAS